jgi:DNA-binding response OmpR family regulator
MGDPCRGMSIAIIIPMKKILLVDDNDLILYSLRKTFCHYPAEIAIARSGTDALLEISSHLYDLCLLDTPLSDIDGIDVMKRIKAVSPDTKIVMMTASPISDDSRGFVDRESIHCISKPFDLGEVKMFIKYLLEDGKPSL